MFDIGFSELLLVMVIGLVVLGPERLPVAVRTVAGWIRALRSLATSVQNELSQELKLQELQDSLKKAETAGLQNLTPELKASMDELKQAAESMKRSYHSEITGSDTEKEPSAAETIPHADMMTKPEADVALAPRQSAVQDAPPVVQAVPSTHADAMTASAQPASSPSTSHDSSQHGR
ncbi:twin-arginine translocase subunit TatB [Edwardsiella ictaluri]|uniref:Sec-independent protein translocase protein TatB n=1 Tax=Edwardsiella ictaluri (strain 93-146) TaxID=634503 RepID=C5BCA8_EDWI9|nr:Sec-independent protein translocase protein TatB [Edwardsiella ictaluri]ACR67399.1 twin arginine-targeting protein translocase TatB, putative [Edwardsiella ictaluri 93-146]ARD39981.1 sec-independent translocase [Edwardsiella ictaluri]AVZ82097.1 twin-arginine translocase subunit TatB [Edwardsiella ictaluri]EKS7762731.1 Sec-independent protein translocase subunit TatB [Edwardsiella ictaluri]EKS7769642.1 Sec-independent protein translocase subunit TatB [Edwardsiella ictaluri]